MCIYMCVCVYLCIRICMFVRVYIHVYVCVCVYLCIRICMYVCIWCPELFFQYADVARQLIQGLMMGHRERRRAAKMLVIFIY